MCRPRSLSSPRRRGVGLEIVDELDIGWRLVPSPVVAVTGTNGKSTVAGLLVSVLERHGLEPVLAGNTEFGPPLSELALGPPPRSIVAEVSSYQAEYSPSSSSTAPSSPTWPPNTSTATERSRPTPPPSAPSSSGAATLCRSPPSTSTTSSVAVSRIEVEERGGRAVRYGRAEDAEYRIARSRWDLRESEIEVETPSRPVSLSIGLPGAHNAMNAVSVLALADCLGLPRAATLAALADASPVPGRFEVIEVDRPFDVVVDFAYSADSVDAVLTTARDIVEPRGGRLIAVVAIVGRSGAITGRDVGRVARERCDHLILSGTSYRGEPRMVTLAALAAGARAAARSGGRDRDRAPSRHRPGDGGCRARRSRRDPRARRGQS